jgi:hypothetical protein
MNDIRYKAVIEEVHPPHNLKKIVRELSTF